jgi:hypothetical protein
MDKTISTMSPQEFEILVENIIDRRMEVWLTQVVDALGQIKEEETAEFTPEFTAALTHSIEQARTGNIMTLNDFRDRLKDG